ncbi:conserved hypothetical protein [Hyella patelloides LEGE 07179]|uniref:Uncharacterized protein n=1 Tax=Hyella patelloides LEGE 07179 TaxID=945734 RepID=A0A563W156_9CYAN|nr:hypothetical protein [Hyella patelloides]VEP17367.1 conserved hypothetical protein [Hyella patelloides LEGE 07179]
MISREQLAKEYINILNNYYPVAGRLLHHCLVRILTLNADRMNKHSYYLGIYYPNIIGAALLEQQDIFRDAAENLGLVEVVFLNANHLVKDPYSKIKRQDFRFWLELCWIAQNKN